MKSTKSELESLQAAEAFQAVAALDLAPIRIKLMHVESGEGWPAARAAAVEAEYRRFLFLMKKYPDAQASPTVDVDTFWHYHILDTMKYARDCEQAFGYFLHHYPYVGIGAQAAQGEQLRAGERMRALYRAEFGAASSGQGAWCASPGKALAEGGAIAWCASPGKPLAVAVNTAWSASPGKAVLKGSDIAWCASPGKALLAA
jgi:hypothetical protein